jgi:hypothetical protein
MMPHSVADQLKAGKQVTFHNFSLNGMSITMVHVINIPYAHGILS